MVMERLRGKSLRQTLSEETRLHPGKAREIALQVLDALSEAHEQGMVHRDLKPDNIMLVPERTGDSPGRVVPPLGVLSHRRSVILRVNRSAPPSRVMVRHSVQRAPAPKGTSGRRRSK